ncbi:MAG: hypothetical protein Q8P57_04480 [Candidatus Pacearchaeota archaeon]|nr:hypothetical protein [Candidatus Pacearchaeota archaeon]
MKKIEEVITSGDVEHYKNLRHDLSNFKRVQIGEKVRVFKFDKQRIKYHLKILTTMIKSIRKNYKNSVYQN